MEMYSTDFAGKYPTSMSQLTPNYLKTIPDCPAAGSISYKLQTGKKAPLNTGPFEDYYLFECTGEHHKSVSVPADYPKYNGIIGLIER